MTAQEKYALQLNAMLSYLELEWLRYSKPSKFWYQPRRADEAKQLNLPTAEIDQIRLLHQIEEQGLIEIIEYYSEDMPKGMELFPGATVPPAGYHIVPKLPDFLNYAKKAGSNSSDGNNPEKLTVKLVKSDNKLVLVADETMQIKRFNTGSALDSLLTFVINSRPNMVVNLNEVKLNTSLVNIASFTEVIRKAGLKPLEGYFVTSLEPTSIRIKPEVQMTRTQLDALTRQFSPKIAKT